MRRGKVRTVFLLTLLVGASVLAGCTNSDEELERVPTQDEPVVPASTQPDEPSDAHAPDDDEPTPAPTTPAAPTDPEPPAEPEAPLDLRAPRAVIAVIDTGINPYHEAFRDDSPRAHAHPSTYLDGYPEDAIALNITFGHANLSAALEADCSEWQKVRTDQLYWFPGTRIVGAIAPRPEARSSPVEAPMPARPITCADPRPTGDADLVGASGHGTMTASRAAGATYGACPECLVVSVQGFGAAQVAWAAAQPWIDVQSNSWGPIVMAPGAEGTPGHTTATPSLARTIEEAAQRQLSFWATGNGAAGRFGVVGHPTQASPHFTPSALRVGGHDAGRVALWPGSSPHVVSDACDSWAAEHESISNRTPRTGGGTSAAAPFAAGLAAQVLLDVRTALGDTTTGIHGEMDLLATGARRSSGPVSDGNLTREELLAALFRTADARPDAIEHDGATCEPTNVQGNLLAPLWSTTPVAWQTVPDGPAAIPLVGYGAVTPATAKAAAEALLGARGMPERPDEDAWFAQDRALRQTTHDAYTQG